jgi:hypothetical protein
MDHFWVNRQDGSIPPVVRHVRRSKSERCIAFIADSIRLRMKGRELLAISDMLSAISSYHENYAGRFTSSAAASGSAE